MSDSNKLVIESGVPIPDTRRGCGRASDWASAWAKMKAGDSFVSDGKSITSYFRQFAARSGFQYCTRKVGESLWRVWKLDDKAKEIQ